MEFIIFSCLLPCAALGIQARLQLAQVSSALKHGVDESWGILLVGIMKAMCAQIEPPCIKTFVLSHNRFVKRVITAKPIYSIPTSDWVITMELVDSNRRDLRFINVIDKGIDIYNDAAELDTPHSDNNIGKWWYKFVLDIRPSEMYDQKNRSRVIFRMNRKGKSNCVMLMDTDFPCSDPSRLRVVANMQDQLDEMDMQYLSGAEPDNVYRVFSGEYENVFFDFPAHDGYVRFNWVGGREHYGNPYEIKEDLTGWDWVPSFRTAAIEAGRPLAPWEVCGKPDESDNDDDNADDDEDDDNDDDDDDDDEEEEEEEDDDDEDDDNEDD